MAQALKDLRKKVVIGFVGGSDLVKQKEQLGENCEICVFWESN
jgi:phosphomannomutase